MAGAASVLTDATPAAPSAPVGKNLRRCMCVSLAGRVLIFAMRRFHLAESACQRCPDRANKKPRRSGAFWKFSGRLELLDLTGGRLAGHEVVEGVLDHAEPQHFLVPEGLPRVIDLLELRVLG